MPSSQMRYPNHPVACATAIALLAGGWVVLVALFTQILLVCILIEVGSEAVEAVVLLELACTSILLPLLAKRAIQKTYRHFRWRKPVPGRCPSCNYDLRGNVSGICPECGNRRGDTVAS